MAPSLDWRVGALGDEAVTTPSPRVVVPRRRGWPGTIVLVVLYGSALVAAAVVGFAIGRWHDVRSANLGGIANQLAVEDLAWREGDIDLYVSTLDVGAAPEAWLMGLANDFSAHSPRVVRHVPVDMELVAPDAATVTVRVETSSDGSGATRDGEIERRWYRSVGNSWLRTAADVVPPPDGGGP